MKDILHQIESKPVLIIVAIICFLILGKSLIETFFLKKPLSKETCDQNSDTCAKEKCVALYQRDAFYTKVLVTIIAILVSVDILLGNADAYNYISFASTITSLVLSVVAIIMTISSDSKNENTKALINKSAEDLKHATEEIKHYANNVESISAEQTKTFEDILSNSKTILDEINQLKDGVNEVKGRMQNKEISLSSNNSKYEEEEEQYR